MNDENKGFLKMEENSKNTSPTFSIGRVEGGIVNVGGQLSIDQANVESPAGNTKQADSNAFLNHEDVAMLAGLRKLIMEKLSVTEVQTLCFDLGIRYDGLSGDNLNARVIDLLQSCYRQNKLEELRAIGNELNPDPHWLCSR